MDNRATSTVTAIMQSPEKHGKSNMTNNHGGKRAGAGSGGPRPGAGRKPQSTKLHVGDQRAAFFSDGNGKAIRPGQMWTVTDIDSNWITITVDDGSVIKIVR